MTQPFNPDASERENRALMEVIALPFIERHAVAIDAIRDRDPGPVPPDSVVLALILEARSDAERWFPAAATRGHYWTRPQVNHLLTIDLPNWCTRHGLARPDNAAEQCWLLLDTLAATELLHFDSDTLAELREPLHCYGELDDAGQPGTQQQSTGCRCYWPTAKQLALGLEQNPPPMPDNFDWYRDERARFAEDDAA